MGLPIIKVYLHAWQMTPYMEALLRQPRSWSCHQSLGKANVRPIIVSSFHTCRGACALRPALCLSPFHNQSKQNISDYINIFKNRCKLYTILVVFSLTYTKNLFAGVADGPIRGGSPAAAAQPSCHQSLSKAAPGSPRAHSHSHPRALPHAPSAAG